MAYMVGFLMIFGVFYAGGGKGNVNHERILQTSVLDILDSPLAADMRWVWVVSPQCQPAERCTNTVPSIFAILSLDVR